MGSSVAGMMLYAVQTAVSLGTGVWLGRGHRQMKTAEQETASTASPHQLIGNTCGALITLCGYVLLAAMVLSITQAMGLFRVGGAALSATVAAVLEVSSGCIALSGLPLAPVWVSMAISWGGLAVHGQIAAAISEERVLTKKFYTARLCHGLLSGALAWGVFSLFPIRLETAVGTTQTLPYSVSVQSSLMLLVLCFFAMLCFSEKKTGNWNKGML